ARSLAARAALPTSGPRRPFGKTFQSEEASAHNPRARAEPPLKKNPSALSNEKARSVVVRQNFYACRAPCRKVLSSGSVDRRTQYKRARAEKASGERRLSDYRAHPVVDDAVNDEVDSVGRPAVVNSVRQAEV